MATADPTINERHAGWPQGVLLAAQGVLPTMGALLLVPVAPLLFAEFGGMAGANYWIPAMLTAPALCIALLSPVAGWLGDLLGRRILLIAALTIYGLAGMAPIILGDFMSILTSRVVLGLCEAVIITLSATLIGDYFVGKPRDRWLAMISTLASLSAVVFLALAGAIGAAYGWRAVTGVYGLSLLFVPAMLLLTWEPQRTVQATSIAALADPTPRFPWKHMSITAAAALFGGVLFYTLVIQQGLALSALGVLDPGRLGLLTSIASLATPIGTLAFWRVSHWRTPLLLAVEFGLIGAACAAIGLVQTDIQFTIAAFAGLFGCGLLMPTLISWTIRSLPFSARGRGTGIFQSAFMLGQFVSSLLIAFLTQSFGGDILHSFVLVGIAAIVVAVLTITLLLRARTEVQA